MKEERDYLQDLEEIRSMMERSSKFLSLSGWAGVMAGFYALAGAWIAYDRYSFAPDRLAYDTLPPELPQVMMVALLVLILALGTAIGLSYRKAEREGESVWNAASRRLLASMAVPLVAGGLLLLLLLSNGLIGLMAPLSLLFYGIALYNAGNITYKEIKYLGLIQIVLGLAGTWFIAYSLLLWAIGFGAVHIIYGIAIHYRYER